jgi:hypothetical protein
LSGECALFALNHECLFLIHAVWICDREKGRRHVN